MSSNIPDSHIDSGCNSIEQTYQASNLPEKPQSVLLLGTFTKPILQGFHSPLKEFQMLFCDSEPLSFAHRSPFRPLSAFIVKSCNLRVVSGPEVTHNAKVPCRKRSRKCFDRYLEWYSRMSLHSSSSQRTNRVNGHTCKAQIALHFGEKLERVILRSCNIEPFFHGN